MMRANVERKYDDYEDMALQAMMNRQATNAKRLKQSDLFKRPVDKDKAESKAEELKQKAEQASEWMSQFTQFSDKVS